ncbi:SUMO-conjugating enzyme UBC9-B-like [Hydractinia symbiolongicarpus]|uniref:SUMO-conjugating enzyme UBC9-B-like n=1 Tax=Hydractinia symbiolongicarpus TaxID=13093 RepID=UPI00254FE7B1|nr:SUMO-conjugating enzyme UBC9-B-like [Hydractinia symbiolongicarpus]
MTTYAFFPRQMFWSVDFSYVPRIHFSMASINTNNSVNAKERLEEEYKAWQRSHPHGFQAKPSQEDNAENLLLWNCAIPGRPKTPWENGLYKLQLKFTKDYPYQPPNCTFNPPIFHPNVYPSGKVALSILERDWTPQITIKQILLGIQLLLDDPNFNNPAQVEAFVLHSQGKHLYEQRVKEQAKKMTPGN